MLPARLSSQPETIPPQAVTAPVVPQQPVAGQPMMMVQAPYQGGQQPMFVQQQPATGVPPGHVMVPVSQPVQFVAAGGPNVPQGGMVFMPQVPTVQTIDKGSLPSHQLIIITIVTLLCLVINITSLAFGIPAIMCAYFAYTSKKNGKYASTKTFSYAGVVLSFINLAYTGFITLLIIGLSFRFHCGVGYRNRC